MLDAIPDWVAIVMLVSGPLVLLLLFSPEIARWLTRRFKLPMTRRTKLLYFIAGKTVRLEDDVEKLKHDVERLMSVVFPLSEKVPLPPSHLFPTNPQDIDTDRP